MVEPQSTKSIENKTLTEKVVPLGIETKTKSTSIDLYSSHITSTTSIPGLRIIENFITKEEEKELISFIDEQKWSDILKRRTQQYGYIYNYSSPHSKPAKTLAIPDIFNRICLAKICKIVKMDGSVVGDELDQCIVNEYTQGQGISPHIDNKKHFGDFICSLSLLCTYNIIFSCGDKSVTVKMPRRSLLILEGDARYVWSHEIQARKTDVIDNVTVPRSRRVSVTFRNTFKKSVQK